VLFDMEYFVVKRDNYIFKPLLYLHFMVVINRTIIYAITLKSFSKELTINRGTFNLVLLL